MKNMNAHLVTITMVEGSVFHGCINIGSCRRVADFFQKSNGTPFIVMFETTKDGFKGKSVYFLNKDHIRTAEPNGLENRRASPDAQTREDIARLSRHPGD